MSICLVCNSLWYCNCHLLFALHKFYLFRYTYAAFTVSKLLIIINLLCFTFRHRPFNFYFHTAKLYLMYIILHIAIFHFILRYFILRYCDITFILRYYFHIAILHIYFTAKLSLMLLYIM